MIDKERIRRRLVEVGSTSPVEWQSPTVDGGKPILRVAARVGDLKKDGVPVETARMKPYAIYVLPRQPRVAVDDDGQSYLLEGEAA